MTTTIRPWWARFVGLLWLVGGAVLAVAGVVVVVDQHDVLRWEFLAAAGALLVGLQAWNRAVLVDSQGIEDRAGRHHRRFLWGTVDHVAVGSEEGATGPVRVWRTGTDDPVVLRGSWGTSRSQRMELVGVLRPLLAPHGITVVSDVDADLDRDPAAERPPGTTDSAHPGGATWTARGPRDG